MRKAIERGAVLHDHHGSGSIQIQCLADLAIHKSPAAKAYQFSIVARPRSIACRGAGIVIKVPIGHLARRDTGDGGDRDTGWGGFDLSRIIADHHAVISGIGGLCIFDDQCVGGLRS